MELGRRMTENTVWLFWVMEPQKPVSLQPTAKDLAHIVGLFPIPLKIVTDGNFGHNAGGDELYAAQQQNEAQNEQRFAADVVARKF